MLILTLLGPVQRPDNVPENSIRCVSAHDHLISNRTFENDSPSVLKLELDNISDVRANPTNYLSNLVLDGDGVDTELRRFLSRQIAKDTNAKSRVTKALFCECTPPQYGRNEQVIFEIAEKLFPEIQVVVGTGWARSKDESNSTVDALAVGFIRELTVGMKVAKNTRMNAELNNEQNQKSSIGCAGFIGEVVLESFPFDDVDLSVLQAVAKAHEKSGGAPILISLGNPSCAFDATEAVIDFFGKFGVDEKKICFSNLVTSIPGGNPELLITRLALLKEKVMKRKVLLSLDCASCSTKISTKDGDYSTISLDELAYVAKSLCDAGFEKQILVGNDLKLKHHWTQYGGHGYGLMVEEFEWRLLSRGLGRGDLDSLLVSNALTWLTWYKPPAAPPPKAITYWSCEFCDKKVKSSKEPFIREGFRYCSMKCLRAHRELLESSSGDSHDKSGGSGGSRGRAGNHTGWGLAVGSS